MACPAIQRTFAVVFALIEREFDNKSRLGVGIPPLEYRGIKSNQNKRVNEVHASTTEPGAREK